MKYKVITLILLMSNSYFLKSNEESSIVLADAKIGTVLQAMQEGDIERVVYLAGDDLSILDQAAAIAHFNRDSVLVNALHGLKKLMEQTEKLVKKNRSLIAKITFLKKEAWVNRMVLSIILTLITSYN